ncbi:Iron-sulfur clusters transporter ABCB7, mitochondrial [Halotydeus destructor]|nr:Iron-sulfur clusters transporter ABCB7, mitochondrial [Halotydeus destructor]
MALVIVASNFSRHLKCPKHFHGIVTRKAYLFNVKRGTIKTGTFANIKRKFGGHFGNHGDLVPAQLGMNMKTTNRQMIMKLLQYVWPKDRPHIRKRVLAALGLLVGSKVLNITVPFLFKFIVDKLNQEAGTPLNASDTASAALTVVIALIVGYGVARAGSSLLGELRNAVFAKVAHDSIRRVSRKVFEHLHVMDMNFHLSRQTGALSKAIDRGSRGINFILQALVFNVVPTIFEVALVSSILWYKCGGQYAAVALGMHRQLCRLHTSCYPVADKV